MKNRKTLWIVTTILIILGFILTIVGLFSNTKRGIYFNKTGMHIISGEMHEEKNLDLGVLEEIHINTSYIDVIFEESSFYGIEIKLSDGDNPIDWHLQDGKLEVTEKNETNIKLFSFDFSFLDKNTVPYIKLYLPKDAYLNILSIKTNNANVHLSNFNVKEINLKNKYGKTDIEKIQSNNAKIEIENGDFYVKNMIVDQIDLNSKYGNVAVDDITSDSLHMELKNGNLKLNNIDTKTMTIKNKYGDIIGKDISSIDSFLETKNGNIDLNGNLSGMTESLSTYGKIILNLKGEKSYYNLDLNSKYGKIILDGEKNSNTEISQIGQNADSKLKIKTNNGDISLYFNP